MKAVLAIIAIIAICSYFVWAFFKDNTGGRE